MSPEVERMKKERIVEAFNEQASEADAAWMASTTVTTLRRWREDDDEFDSACTRAVEEGIIDNPFSPDGIMR